MPNYFGLTEYIDRQIARYDNDIKHSSTRDEIHEFSGSRQALIDLKENLNEVPKKQVTPYDNFCSRDSRLLSDVYNEGRSTGIREERKRIGKWLKERMFDDSIWTDGYADALARGELPNE